MHCLVSPRTFVEPGRHSALRREVSAGAGTALARTYAESGPDYNKPPTWCAPYLACSHVCPQPLTGIWLEQSTILFSAILDCSAFLAGPCMQLYLRSDEDYA